ncbi:caskin-1-like isoform X3 [Petromyzon marinus]|uniref:Caskin-1-like isoform X3 n=1 Tax=Petromyzon marinus TaxID=7757 RepID=A0AAJ7TS58_PETMA|nr:caskin-1-like isoform X3 [Petromyzon marinus]
MDGPLCTANSLSLPPLPLGFLHKYHSPRIPVSHHYPPPSVHPREPRVAGVGGRGVSGGRKRRGATGTTKWEGELLGSTKRPNINHQDEDGFSALHHAALNGNTEIMNLLLEAQAHVDMKDNKGLRPLHYAAWQGKVEPLRILLKAGSSVNLQSGDGQIPLHLSVQNGHYQVSELLLQHQANPCIVNNNNKTPLDLACEFGRLRVVKLLLSSNVCPTLLEGRPHDPSHPNSTSALHLAAKNGHVDIIRMLILAGVDVNRQTRVGTALHEAALYGKTEAVRLLIESGVNVHIRNSYNQTALDIVNQFTGSQACLEIKQMLREATSMLQVRALRDYCNVYDPTSLSVKAGEVITVLEQHPDGRWKGYIQDSRGADRVGFFPPSVVELVSRRNVSCLSPGLGPGQAATPSTAGPRAYSYCTLRVSQHARRQQQQQQSQPQQQQQQPQQQPQQQQQASVAGATAAGHSYFLCQPLSLPLPPPPPAPETQALQAEPAEAESQGETPGQTGGSSSTEDVWAAKTPTGGDRSSIGSTGSVGSSRSSGSGQSAGSGNGQHHASNGETVKPVQVVQSLQPVPESEVKLPEHASGSGHGQHTLGAERPAQKSIKRHERFAEDKEAEAIYLWLREFQLEQYVDNFINAGYDLPTISRMTPEDLTAIGVTKPGHRKKITSEISKLNVQDWLPDYRPAGLGEWLALIGLAQYHATLVENGYEKLEFVSEITWEDLHEIGITKLGHQKKLMLAVRRLSELQRFEEQHQARLEGAAAASGTLKRRPGPASPASTTTMAIVSHGPPGDPGSPPPAQPLLPQPPLHPQPGSPASCRSPKLSTFQDSELSPELQAAMSGVACLATLSPGVTRDSAGLVARAIRYGGDISASQESLGGRSGGSGNSQPTAVVLACSRASSSSQESVGGGGGGLQARSGSGPILNAGGGISPHHHHHQQQRHHHHQQLQNQQHQQQMYHQHQQWHYQQPLQQQMGRDGAGVSGGGGSGGEGSGVFPPEQRSSGAAAGPAVQPKPRPPLAQQWSLPSQPSPTFSTFTPPHTPTKAPLASPQSLTPPHTPGSRKASATSPPPPPCSPQAFVFPCPGGGKAGKPPGAAGHSPARPCDVVRTPPYAQRQQRQQRQLQDSPRSPMAFPFPPPPATKGPAHAQTRSEPPAGPGATRLAGAMPVLPLEAGVAVRPAKKRSQSLSRYGGGAGAASDGEHEAASAADDEPRPFSSDALFTVAPAGGAYGPGSYATLGRRVGRSHSVRGRGFPLPPPPDAGDGAVNRSHSFAVRQRKRGPPPPPPKRSSSTIASGSTLADTQDPEAGGEEWRLQRRRRWEEDVVPPASVRRDTLEKSTDWNGNTLSEAGGGPPSVRSIAAMLEKSALGGLVPACSLESPSPGETCKPRAALPQADADSDRAAHGDTPTPGVDEALSAHIVGKDATDKRSRSRCQLEDRFGTGHGKPDGAPAVRRVSSAKKAEVANVPRDVAVPAAVPCKNRYSAAASVDAASSELKTGARKRTTSEPPCASPRLEVGVQKAAPEGGLPPAKQLGMESSPCSSQGSSAESIPFAEEGNQTIKQRPKNGWSPTRGEALDYEGNVVEREALGPTHGDGSRNVDNAAFLAPVEDPSAFEQGLGAPEINLTETDTVKRRPKAKERSPQKGGEAAVARVQPRAAAQPPPPPPPPPPPYRGAEAARLPAGTGDRAKPTVSPKPSATSFGQARPPGPPPPLMKKPSMHSSTGKDGSRDYPPGSLPPPPPPPPMSVKTGAVASPSEQDVVFKRNAGRPHKKPPLPAHLFSSEPSNDSSSSSSSNRRSVPHSPGRMEEPAATPVENNRATAPVRDDRERPPESPGGGGEAATAAAGDGGRPESRSGLAEVAQHRLEETSASLAAALQAVEDTLRHDGRDDGKPRPTGNLLDDIGSMFDDLADQLDAMLD